MKFGHKRSFASSKKILVAAMEKSVNNCIGYIGQTSKNRYFRKFEKSAPPNIEHLVEISMFVYDRVNRPTYGDLNPIFDTDFSRRIDWYRSPTFLMAIP